MDRMEINTMIQKVTKEKDFFFSLLKDLVSGKGSFIESYCVFLGCYYFLEDQEKIDCAIDALNSMQLKMESNYFPYYNNALCQAHYYLQPLLGNGNIKNETKRFQVELQSNITGKTMGKDGSIEIIRDTKWKALNPFLTVVGGKVLCGVRVTDFDREGTRYFSAHGGKIQNYYECSFPSLDFVKSNPLVLDFVDKTEGTYKKYDGYTHVSGFEDYRVAPISFPSLPTPDGNEREDVNKFYAACVTIDAHEGKPMPRMSLLHCSLSSSSFPSTSDVQGGIKGDFILEKLVPLWGTPIDNNSCQKNWLPFYVEEESSPHYGKLLAIYQSHPKFQVIEINPETGECSLVFEEDMKVAYHFRGGSPPVKWKDGYIFSVHLVGFLDNGRVYYHRLVKMDNDFRLTSISNLFCLNENNGIEYISGALSSYSKGYPKCLMDNRENEVLHLSFGFNDKEAWICTLEEEQVEKLFP